MKNTEGNSMLTIIRDGRIDPPLGDADLPTDPPTPDDPDGLTTVGSVAVTRLDTPLRQLLTTRYGIGVVMVGDNILDIDSGLEFSRQLLAALSMANRLRKYAR